MEVSIHEDTTFLITNELGDILEGTVSGLYWQDTRFLSRYEMDLDGRRPVPLDNRASGHHAVHFLTNSPMARAKLGDLSIVRKRTVGRGLHEDIDIVNYGAAAVEMTLGLQFGVDFAHIFEVKGMIESPEESVCPPSKLSQEVSTDGKTISLSSEDDGFSRTTLLHFSMTPVLTPGKQAAVTFPVAVQPRQSWHLCIDILTLAGPGEIGAESPSRHGGAGQPAESEDDRRLREQAYLLASPTLETDHDTLKNAYERAIRDLAALRVRSVDPDEMGSVLVAGIPWFMAAFGRDMLITAFQAMPYHPDLAQTGLRFLARHQGTKVDKLSAEEPGKILHEYRFGALGGCKRVIPSLPYYGTVDATPLFLITLSEYHRVTGDIALVRELKDHILRALDWMDEYGDRDGDGYLEYIREGKAGLANQGWKDSGTAIRFADGRYPEAPIALCEVQGYAYDARLRCAELLDSLGEPDRAAAEREGARRLKESFDDDFWMEDQQFYAVALDRDKRKVDSITSNPGHLLWSGIVEEERAGLVVKRLLSGDMFSGWGVRTMATTEASYNPISYQNGSVWPHDNSLIAAGLARYGFFDEAITIILAMLAAASRFSGFRPPELFCGYSRSDYDFPVAYPTASSPQAWASGAILLMLTSLLRLGIDAPHRRIDISPLPPLPGIDFLNLYGIKAGGDVLDIRGRSTTDVLEIEVLRSPADFQLRIR